MPDPRSFALTQFPEYQAAQKRLGEVQLELVEVEKKIGGILTDLTHHTPLSFTEKARALLAGKSLARETEPALTELGRLQERRRLLGEAIKLQRQSMQDLGYRFAERVCTDLRPDYIKIVARVAAAVAELGAALDEEREFRMALQEAGVEYSSYLRPMPFLGVGGLDDPANPQTNAVLYLAEVRRYYPEAFPKNLILPPGLPGFEGEDSAAPPRKLSGRKLRVKLNTILAGPDGCGNYGEIVAVPEEFARELIALQRAWPVPHPQGGKGEKTDAEWAA